MAFIETKNNQYSSLALMAVCLILAALIGFFFIKPKYSDYQQKKIDLAAKETLRDNAEKQDNQARASFKILDTNKDKLARLDITLPAKPNIPDLYAHLEQLAKRAGLTIASIDAADYDQTKAAADAAAAGVTSPDASLPPNIGVVRVNLSARGTFEGLQQFLGSMEDSLQLLDVQKMDIHLDSSSTKLSYQFVIKTYFQK